MAEPSKEQRATLSDIVNYKPEQYLTEDEIGWIRNTFKDNNYAIRVLRKIFVPTISDPDLPLEEMANDFLLKNRNWDQIPAEEAKILITARQEALKFILGGFISLKMVAHQEQLSPIQLAKKQKDDSNQ